MTEREIFLEALEMATPEARAAYLQGACGRDATLRRKVDELLKEHFSNDSLLAEPSRELEPPTLKHDRPPDEVPAQMLGRYKLLEKIGEGGFGEVWMAEQREPIKRRVALKIIKLGMDSRQIVNRFAAERQALAMMDHPNIAKIFDAGTMESTVAAGVPPAVEPGVPPGGKGAPISDAREGSRPCPGGRMPPSTAGETPAATLAAGRPYFVMELVRGIKITEDRDQNQLPTHERLRLFILVCQAIQHAHQKGIIHRDIKPSNILVTLHDGVPVPKVIDFGIAKATQQELTDKTVFTQFQQFIGTPAYISPEQAEMSGLDIDTRADIYSLGVLLYELLVGQTPFDAREMMQGGLDALRQIIREKEPLRPSTKLNTLAGEARATAGKRRQTEVGKLVHQLQGDLDWIVMKCLEKDRTRRYETANGLAVDIQRHLNDEAVLARPPSAAYRFRKLAQRNKLAFAAVGGVACAVLLGAVVSTWQAVRATNAEQAEKAQAEQARADRDRAVLAEGDSRIQAGVAKDAWATARRNAYAAEINVAFQALAENNLARAIELLNRQRPKPGEEDLRGFEWRYLWQLCRPDEKATFSDEGAHGIAFSPDGKWLAYGGQIVIREMASQAVVATIPSPATTLVFSPGAKLLASGHDTGVKLWNTETWQEVRSLPDAMHPALFSPDGRWLLTGVAEGFRVWDAQTWQPLGLCTGVPRMRWNTRNAVAFSSDGKLLVTPGHRDGFDAGQFQVWDFPSLIVRSNFAPFPGNLGSAVFAPDGKHLLTGRRDGVLLVWNVTEGKVVETHHEHTDWITSITFARDGKTFATASSDRTLLVWDAPTRRPLVRLRGHLGEILSVAMSPDGRTLASGSADGTTKLWDTITRHEGRELAGFPGAIGFSADSRLLVVGSWDGAGIWHLDDGATTKIPVGNASVLHAFRGRGHPMDVHGNEPLGVLGRLDGALEFWNLATHSRIALWPAHEGEVTAVVFSQDGRLIATSDTKGEVKLWEATTTHREVKRLGALGEELWCLAFSPDGRLLAGSGMSSRVRVWDAASGSLVLDLGGHNETVASIAFSPDGKLLATGEVQGNTVRLWEIPSGSLRATLKGHTQGVFGVAFTPDGKTLATGGHDRRVKLWNIATEQEVATLQLPDAFSSFRFSPDGRTLAVGYENERERHLRLWQSPSFEEIAAVEATEKTEMSGHEDRP